MIYERHSATETLTCTLINNLQYIYLNEIKLFNVKLPLRFGKIHTVCCLDVPPSSYF